MPAPDFWLRAGDTKPALVVRLIEGTSAKDLTGKTVKFFLEDEEGNNVISGGAVTVLDAAAGRCSYSWRDGETNVPERYFGRFYVVEDDESFPNYRDLIIQIYG